MFSSIFNLAVSELRSGLLFKDLEYSLANHVFSKNLVIAMFVI